MGGIFVRGPSFLISMPSMPAGGLTNSKICNRVLFMQKRLEADTNLVNLSEASRLLEIDYSTLWRWIKKGKVAPVRLLGMPFLTLEQIESLKNQKNNQATRDNQAA